MLFCLASDKHPSFNATVPPLPMSVASIRAARSQACSLSVDLGAAAAARGDAVSIPFCAWEFRLRLEPRMAAGAGGDGARGWTSSRRGERPRRRPTGLAARSPGCCAQRLGAPLTIFATPTRARGPPLRRRPLSPILFCVWRIPDPAAAPVRGTGRSPTRWPKPQHGKGTPRGKKLQQRLRPKLRAANERILAPLTRTERKLLIDLLSRVIEGNQLHARPGAGRRKPRMKGTS